MMVAPDRHRCIQWCQPKLSGSISKMYGLSNLLVNQEGGIECLNDLDEILKLTKFKDGRCANDQWVIQKYIENPMIILNRKLILGSGF